MTIDAPRFKFRATHNVDPALLQLRETLRRLDMRLRSPPSSPAELDAMLAAYHGARQ